MTVQTKKKIGKAILAIVMAILAIRVILQPFFQMSTFSQIFLLNGLVALIASAFGAANAFPSKIKVSVKYVWIGMSLLLAAVFVDLGLVVSWAVSSRFWPLLIIATFIWRKPVMSLPEKLFVKIQDNPTHCGVVEVWGKRSGETVKPGYKPSVPFFPFKLTYHPISLEQRKTEIIITVWCKAATKMYVECRVRFSIIWRPDSKKTDDFINKGKSSGIIDLLADIAEAKVEKFSEDEKWSEFLSHKQKVQEALSDSITGKTTLFTGDGMPDNHNLGIEVFGILVDDIEPVSDDLKIAMLQLPMEQAQRISQHYQATTDRTSAQKLVELSGDKISLKDAMAMIVEVRLLDEAKAVKTITDFKGLGSAGAGGSLIAAMSQSGKGGGK